MKFLKYLLRRIGILPRYRVVAKTETISEEKVIETLSDGDCTIQEAIYLTTFHKEEIKDE